MWTGALCLMVAAAAVAVAPGPSQRLLEAAGRSDGGHARLRRAAEAQDGGLFSRAVDRARTGGSKVLQVPRALVSTLLGRGGGGGGGGDAASEDEGLFKSFIRALPRDEPSPPTFTMSSTETSVAVSSWSSEATTVGEEQKTST